MIRHTDFRRIAGDLGGACGSGCYLSALHKNSENCLSDCRLLAAFGERLYRLTQKPILRRCIFVIAKSLSNLEAVTARSIQFYDE
jgi:hypothetical protein